MLDPLTGRHLVTLSDVATITPPADATIAVDPTQFDCSETGLQSVVVTVLTAPQVKFNRPAGIVADPAGGFYISDSGNRQIKKIPADGTVTTIAWSGDDGNSDGQGSAASFGIRHGWRPSATAFCMCSILNTTRSARSCLFGLLNL